MGSSNKTDLGFKTMMKIVFKLLLSSVLIAAIFADEFESRTKGANYDGYKLIRTNLLHNNQAIELQNWEEDFDFWRPPQSGFSTDILVDPGQLETLSNQLKVQDQVAISAQISIVDLRNFQK